MKSHKIVLSAALASSVMVSAAPAHAGVDPYVGDIVAYGMTFCPSGWLPADGRLLSISENETLFILYGTTYGGDGQNTFALPDLRGRAAVGEGSTTFGTFVQGQQSGSETFTITTATMPSHTHTATLMAVPSDGNTNVPTGNSMARDASAANQIYSTAAPANNMNAGDVAIGSTGSGTPVPLTSPALAMTYCVSQFGPFPPTP